VTDDEDGLLFILRDARVISVEAVALARLDRRVVERKIDGLELAAGIDIAAVARAEAQAVYAIFVVGAVLVLRALFGAFARAGLALTAGTAFTVGRARFAGARLADLAERTLIVTRALLFRDAGICAALLATWTLRVVATFDTFIRRADLAVLALFVALAARGFRLAAASNRQHQREGRDRNEDLAHMP
jgi:hypothetical protein